MKKTLTWLRLTHTLTAEQSRAEQSRAVNSFSAAFCCLDLGSKYLDEKTHFQHGITSC